MKKLLLSILTITAFSVSANAQWTQVGADIDGEAASDLSGTIVSVNDDGSIMAIGAPSNDGNGTDAGHVRLYQNISGTWSQIGSDINGEAAGDLSGSSLSISNDGSVIAIGAPSNDGNGTNAGHVRLYQNISGTWSQIGSDINGEAAGDLFGTSISLSGDGSTVVIGAIGNDGSGIDAGHARVFENLSGIWTQVGNDIDGFAAGDEFGNAVSVTDDGSIIAIAAHLRYIQGPGYEGQVTVYQNISGTWTQIGSDISGVESNGNFGSSICLNSTGNFLAIGAKDNANNTLFKLKAGTVRVYENISGTWTQIGSTIEGPSNNSFLGTSVGLSNDGMTVISATPPVWSGKGRTMVYEYMSGNWTQVGSSITGEANSDYSGQSVSINGDGSVIVIGAPFNDGNGTDAGHVRVYEFNEATYINEVLTQNLSIYPNPTSSQITLNTPEQIKSILILDITGKTVKTITKNTTTIDVSELVKGIYFLQVQTDKGIANSKFIKE